MEEWREEMATIKDIAEMAGVSITTVSRILNNDSSLSTTMETKQKVIDAAKKLNYKKVGRSTKATFRLGIVQWFSAEQELQDTYYLSVRNGIEDFCIKNCIQIVRAFKTDVNYMDYLENINGLICIGKFSKKEVKELKRISKNIVFLDMPVAEREMIAQIPFDEQKYMAAINVKALKGEKGYSTLERNSCRPSFDICGIWGGYTGEGSKTVLPSKAYAKVSCRLVPHQNHEKISKLFVDYINAVAPDYVKVKVTDRKSVV